MTQQNNYQLVWRGESSGEMFDTFELSKTNAGCGFFFAQHKEHAQWYAAKGTQARAFLIDPGKCLDLRDVYAAYIRDQQVRNLIDALKAEFDEWVDRHSGEEGHPNDWIEAGTLYDYEGDGSGQRWNTLFRLAWAHGFDSVVVHDVTDGEAAITWVVKDPSQIKPAADLNEPIKRRSVRPR